jgi:esterase/lipase superfamily enzyme
VREDCGGYHDVALAGASLGAFHAANFALRRADLFPRALCLSGVYDIARGGWGERGEAMYFHNPMDYVSHLDGDHLDWLRSRVRLTLVVGQGMWEDTTGALDSTHAFASLLDQKGIPHELDVWGHDVPHDWPSWRAQLAHHLPRLLAQ